MAPQSSTLAWKIPWTEEPGRLQSMGLLRVGHDWATSLSLFTFMHWRRKWQPTAVFLPGEFYGLRSLVGYSPWSHKELDTAEQLHPLTHSYIYMCVYICVYIYIYIIKSYIFYFKRFVKKVLYPNPTWWMIIICDEGRHRNKYN